MDLHDAPIGSGFLGGTRQAQNTPKEERGSLNVNSINGMSHVAPGAWAVIFKHPLSMGDGRTQNFILGKKGGRAWAGLSFWLSRE